MPLLSSSAYGIVLLVLILQVGTGGKYMVDIIVNTFIEAADVLITFLLDNVIDKFFIQKKKIASGLPISPASGENLSIVRELALVFACNLLYPVLCCWCYQYPGFALLSTALPFGGAVFERKMRPALSSRALVYGTEEFTYSGKRRWRQRPSYRHPWPE